MTSLSAGAPLKGVLGVPWDLLGGHAGMAMSANSVCLSLSIKNVSLYLSLYLFHKPGWVREEVPSHGSLDPLTSDTIVGRVSRRAF